MIAKCVELGEKTYDGYAYLLQAGVHPVAHRLLRRWPAHAIDGTTPNLSGWRCTALSMLWRSRHA